MTLVRCIDCIRAGFKSGDEWCRKGKSTCALHTSALKFNPEQRRDCADFEKAPGEVIAKREKWMREVVV